MIRPLALASLIAFTVLPGLPGVALVARADGFAEPASPLGWRPQRPPIRHARARSFVPRPPVLAFAPFLPQPDLAYGWLPRNLNLPIYNAPSEGPAPTL